MSEGKEINCYMTEKIVCPYCGHQEQDSWESSDSDDNCICGVCEKHFRYDSETTRYFTSYQVPCLNGESHLFSEWSNVLPQLNFRYCKQCHQSEYRKKKADD